ncbi:hypothetical protein [Cetobacterium sp.]|uniref:hypothetical protein n=1 Tax=Cetobacterium sp. TaxID=2071632 RepID=UPI003F3C045E
MSKHSLNTTGKILCKGSGLKAYFEITLSKDLNNGEKEYKTFRYEVGHLQQFLSQTNRQASFSHVCGRSTSVGVNKGLRSSYGTITFQQLNAGTLYEMFQDVKRWNEEKSSLEDTDLDGFSFEDWSLAEPNAPLLGEATEEHLYKLYNSEAIMLDDLPPIDVIVVGTADQIDIETGIYEVNKTYMFKAEKVTFLSETFGISAGSPLHNVATQVLILGKVHPWKVIE